jgi:hypothetical protein
MRVEVVAEQQRELLVRGSKEARRAVVAEVALVDRLEPERESCVAQGGEDRLALGIIARRVAPQRALAGGLLGDLVPEVNR